MTVTVKLAPNLLELPAALEQQIGNKTADIHIYFLPSNSDGFGGGSGMGLLGGTRTWMRLCRFGTLLHEMSHNLGESCFSCCLFCCLNVFSFKDSDTRAP